MLSHKTDTKATGTTCLLSPANRYE